MQIEIVLAIGAIAASVLLGSISNWIYDLLKARGVLSEQINFRAVMVVLFASVPLIMIIVLSQVSGPTNATIVSFLQTPLPIWQAIVITLCFCTVVFGIEEKRILQLSKIVSEQHSKLVALEARLNASERRTAAHDKSAGFPPEDGIINPK